LLVHEHDFVQTRFMAHGLKDCKVFGSVVYFPVIEHNYLFCSVISQWLCDMTAIYLVLTEPGLT